MSGEEGAREEPMNTNGEVMLGCAIKLAPDENGTLLVTCAAFPELTVFGVDNADARRRFVDAIEGALAARLADSRDLPLPAESRGARFVALPTLTALKVLLWHALRQSGITRAELARRLDWHREQVDRLFRIDHASRLDMIDAAFRALGADVTVAARFQGRCRSE